MKCLLLLFVASLPLLGHAKNVFIENGKSSGAIVIEKDASKAAQRGARELQHYLELQTGVKMPIASETTSGHDIILGFGKYAKEAGLTLDGLNSDGFRITAKNGNLYLYGRDYTGPWPLFAPRSWFEIIHIYNKKLDLCAFGEAGTFHAVMYLLKKYGGCRWFMPGPLGEVIPKRADFVLEDLNLERSPAFEYRFLNFGLWDHNPEVAEWNGRAGFGSNHPVMIGHSFYRFNYLRKEHPEYMALGPDGTRADMVNGLKGQLCLSAPGLDRIVADSAIAYFKAHPEQIIFSVMPNDNTDMCRCEKCRAQIDETLPEYSRASRYVWGFVNRVAKMVAPVCPGKLIGCCAYANYMTIPEGMTIEPNVAVMHTKSVPWRFDDFYRWRNDVNVGKWAKACRNFYTWDYYCWDHTNSHLTGLPILVSHWLADDVKNLQGHSKGMFIDTKISDEPINGKYLMAYPEFNHLNVYLYGELLWEPSLNVDALLDDYYKKFYGPAWAEMKNFWTYAEQVWCNMDVKDRSVMADLQKTLYTPAVLARLKGYLEAAQAKLNPDSPEAQRIRVIQKHFYTYVDRVANTRSRCQNFIVKKILPSEAPVIDGRREAVWRKANAVDFVDSFSSQPPKASTYVRALHDGINLYLFIVAEEPFPEKIRSLPRKRDDINYPYFWEDDAAEIFIVPNAEDPKSFFQISVNAKGNTLVDRKSGNEVIPGHDFDWNSAVRFKTGTVKKGWTLEMAIPLAELNLKGDPRMNFCRDRQASGVIERSSWAPTLSDGWKMAPFRAGVVALEK